MLKTFILHPIFVCTTLCAYTEPALYRSWFLDDVHCESSSASPLSLDVTKVINNANTTDPDPSVHRKWCVNENGVGSQCQHQFTIGTAEISLCGFPEGLHCTDLADIAAAIQFRCKTPVHRTVDGVTKLEEVVGGFYQFVEGPTSKMIIANPYN